MFSNTFCQPGVPGDGPSADRRSANNFAPKAIQASAVQASTRAFHLGAFRCACATGYPVVPIALRGARTAMRDGEWIPRRGAIEISVLPAIAPDGADFAATVRPRERVRAAIQTHCGEPDAAGPLSGAVASRPPASTVTDAL